jgi:vesicle transport through interaction with t-SNAREs protein 1
MEMELNSLPPATKNRLQPRLRNYRTDYEKSRTDLKRVAGTKSDREELLAGAYNGDSVDVEIQSMDQRARLLAGTNRLNDASKRLADSHRVALETEQIGVSTLETLRMQRDQINRANTTVSNC